jgi:tetratricopeptide (TPR) repeat protein
MLEQFDREHPEHREARYLLGVANRRLGRLDEAFTYFQQAEDLGWPLDEITCQRHMARFQGGDLDGTRDYLQALILGGTDDDTAAEVYEALAKGFLAEFRLSDAAVVLDHWIGWRPEEIQPRLWRAELHEQTDNWSAAAEHYRKVVAIDPRRAEAWLRLGEVLLSDQKVDEARAALLQAQQLSPHDEAVLFDLAQCERRLGKTDQAVTLLERVAESEAAPRLRSQAFSALGQIALYDSQQQRAADCFTAALKHSPSDGETHHLLATTLARLGRNEDAKVHFEESQRILDLQRRIRELTNKVMAQPGDVASRLEIATLLRKLERNEEASRWLLTVLHLDPTHAPARTALAEIVASHRPDRLPAGNRQTAFQAATTPAPPRSLLP